MPAASGLKSYACYDSLPRILIPSGMSPPVYSIVCPWILGMQHWFYHSFPSIHFLNSRGDSLSSSQSYLDHSGSGTQFSTTIHQHSKNLSHHHVHPLYPPNVSLRLYFASIVVLSHVSLFTCRRSAPEVCSVVLLNHWHPLMTQGSTNR